MSNNKIWHQPLYWLVLLSLLADLLVRPEYSTSAGSAQSVIWAQLAATALLLAFALVFSACRARRQLLPLVRFATGAVLALSAGQMLLRAQHFYRGANDGALSGVVVLAVLLGGALYAAHCGVRTAGRAASLVAWLLAVSLVLLAFANLRGANVTNLVQNTHPARGALEACLTQIYLPPELLLGMALLTREDSEEQPLSVRQEQSLWTRALLLRGALACLMALGAELVLGAQAQQYLQTVQTLSRLGGISVFRRMDALHGGIWLLVLLCKAAALLCAAAALLRQRGVGECGRLLPDDTWQTVEGEKFCQLQKSGGQQEIDKQQEYAAQQKAENRLKPYKEKSQNISALPGGKKEAAASQQKPEAIAAHAQESAPEAAQASESTHGPKPVSQTGISVSPRRIGMVLATAFCLAGMALAGALGAELLQFGTTCAVALCALLGCLRKEDANANKIQKAAG